MDVSAIAALNFSRTCDFTRRTTIRLSFNEWLPGKNRVMRAMPTVMSGPRQRLAAGASNVAATLSTSKASTMSPSRMSL